MVSQKSIGHFCRVPFLIGFIWNADWLVPAEFHDTLNMALYDQPLPTGFHVVLYHLACSK